MGKIGRHRRLYGTDIDKNWVETGKLPEILDFISECAKKLVSQREMCEQLGINQSTFSSMKKFHPDIQAAIDKAKYELKKPFSFSDVTRSNFWG